MAKPNDLPLGPAVLDVPVLRQNADHDCGRAAAEAACLTVGAKFDPAKFRADPLDGIDPAGMETQLRELGLFVAAGNMDVALLRAVTAVGRPVLTPIQVDGNGHWVVVRGVCRNKVHVMDPYPSGRAVYTAAEFLAAWHDSTRRGWHLRQWGLVVWKG